MRTEALEYLACPSCHGHLVADGDEAAEDGHIMTGELVCTCHAHYPIRQGIPQLTPTNANLETDPLAEQTAQRFGTEWHLFNQHREYYEQQFLDWVFPLTVNDFSGRVVLEGGCGKGRHTQLVSRFGARAIVSIDLGSAVEVAFAATRHLPNVHIVRGDIIQPPVQPVFEVGFSVGVLHHLPNPIDGFRALCGRILPGGRVAIWVYGHESNEWIVRYVDPVRKAVTSKMPETALYWASMPPAMVLAAALRLYRSNLLAKRLPYGAYLHYISRFPLKEVHHILFDQLVTPIAHYLPKQEVQSWFRDEHFERVQIHWHNENSWRASAYIA